MKITSTKYKNETVRVDGTPVLFDDNGVADVPTRTVLRLARDPVHEVGKNRTDHVEVVYEAPSPSRKKPRKPNNAASAAMLARRERKVQRQAEIHIERTKGTPMKEIVKKFGRKTAAPLLALLVVVLTPSVALAAEAVVSTATQEILVKVIEIVGTLLGVVATWAVWKAKSYFEKKTKIDIPEKYEALMESWAQKGVNYAKEIAHKKAKESVIYKGPEKLELALKFGLDLAEEHKLDARAKEKLEKYIHAKLGEAR